MWLHASNISCTHGFSTRYGGLSNAPFDSLNLGGHEDDPALISSNRKLALEALKQSLNNLCTLKQVHGTGVCEARPGQQEGDALVTNEKNLVLAVSIADCYPILFYDPENAVVGAAHAGWRGTVGKIAANTVQGMLQLGAQTKNIQVAIGPGISWNNFEVGNEVKEQFFSTGFSHSCFHGNKIDLVACNRFVLEAFGISGKNIWSMDRCTFESDFFSYRRDKGKTGRMWGLITLNTN